MSKSISSYRESEKPGVIGRRLLTGNRADNPIRGLGYWAAVDAMKKVGSKVPSTKTGK